MTERAIFLEADAIEDAEARDALLRERCGDDTSMLARLRELLELGDDDDALLTLDPGEFVSLRTARDSVQQGLAEQEQFLLQLGKGQQHLGDYELIEEIGRGAAGVVFKAKQASLNRTVAVKFLLGAMLATPQDRERLRVEAEAAANLDHPHIVPIYEIGEHEGHDFYSMRLITGGTLADRMKEMGTNPKAAVELMVKVADAVRTAHERGILHRDLKPDNILLDEIGNPWVSDFGLAARLDQDSRLTLTGQIMGTPKYMAPEQATGGEMPVTVASDVYGLGAVLYELLAGQPVFESDSVLRILELVRDEVPRPLRQIRSEIDRDLETIVHKCLEKEPAKRYGSVLALQDDLKAWLEGRPIAARPPTRVERLGKWARRRPAYAALVGMSFLFLLALGVGGPILAYQQSLLRKHADEARTDADRQRKLADRHRKLAETRAENNRRLLYISSMNQAGAAKSSEGFAPGIIRLLDRWQLGKEQAETDLRGWEWYYLSSFLNQREQLIPGEVGIVELQLDPSGKRFAVTRRHVKEIEIRDAAKGELQHLLHGHQLAPWGVSWSPDGRRLASASLERDLVLWDTTTGTLLKRVKTQDDAEGRSVAWSPDGKTLASAGLDRWVRFWDAETLEEHADRRIQIPIPVGELAWSPDGEYLVARGRRAPRTGYVYLLPANPPGAVPIPIQAHKTFVSSLAWSPGGSLLATGSNDQSIGVWALEDGTLRLVKLLHGLSGVVNSVAWGPEGRRLIAGTPSRELKIWDVQSGELIDDLPGESGIITNVAWSAAIGKIFAGDGDGGITVWDPERDRVDQTLLEEEAPIRALNFSPDGAEIAAGMDGQPVMIVDLKTSATRSIGRPVYFESRRLGRIADGAGLSYRFQPNRLDIFDTVSGKRRLFYHHQAGNIVSHAWTPDGRSLVLCGGWHALRYVKILDAEDLSVKHVLHEKEGPPLSAVSVSPDGKFVLTVGSRLSVYLWETATGRLVFESQDDNSRRNYREIAWSPDSRRFALACSDNTVHLWDPANQELTAKLTGHSSDIYTVAWHPGGDRLASGGKDSTIRIWDTDSGEFTLTLRGHEGPVSSVHWSPDGRSLASSSLDGTVRLWDASRAYRRDEE